ncbi:MAG: DUF1285 domain-containing protein [Rhodobacteraceae bacterium]|nr:DUF1285 domain-containing protein [Paracoccaceae bacterium]
MPVKPSMDGLAEGVRDAGKGKGPAPVHLWNPPLSGDIDIRIDRDGQWTHEGGAFRREALVRLFSTILKREGDAYFLVTPVEKWRIVVEDVPFVAVDVEADGEGKAQVLRFETNVGEVVNAGPEHPVRMVGEVPYVMVRAGLEARVDRKSFYRMVEMGEERVEGFGVWSGGVFFPLMEV